MCCRPQVKPRNGVAPPAVLRHKRTHSGSVPVLDESLAVLSSSVKKNLPLEFSDAGTAARDASLRFKVVAYYPLQFAELRRRYVVGGELAFLLSLSRCKRWHPRGGKTTAYFAKTHDERFVVKQLSRPEKVRAQHRASEGRYGLDPAVSYTAHARCGRGITSGPCAGRRAARCVAAVS